MKVPFGPANKLRIGYLVARSSALLDALVQRTSDCGFSAPAINQEIASWILDHRLAEQAEAVRRGYREKALAVRRAVDEHLGQFLERLTGGRAGFYFYLTFRGLATGEKSPFFRHLARVTGDEGIDGPPGALRPRVFYLPGEYCVDPQGDLVSEGARQLRLSYAYEETERIVEAVRMMREAAERAAGEVGDGTVRSGNPQVEAGRPAYPA